MKMKDFRNATAFISSTFADMVHERNLIMYSVLPVVKQWAFERGIIFDIVDLRWGITSQQAKDLHHTMKICLKKVQESDPLFVCFLGDRYGWIPGEEDFCQEMFRKNIDRYKDCSATELEIAQAMDSAFFDSPAKSCVFLFREPLKFDGVPEAVSHRYVSENTEKLDALKKSIVRRHDVIHYSATFQCSDEQYPLGDFMADGQLLEDILIDRFKEILTEKYQIESDEPAAFENILVKQQYHLKQLSLQPRSEQCQKMLQTALDESQDFEKTLVGIAPASSMYSQVAQFILDQQTTEYKIVYRFMNVDDRIKNARDLIASIAFELSGDQAYLDDHIASLVFVKEYLEETDERYMLILAPLTGKTLFECINLLNGLKFFKQVLIVEDSHAQGWPCYLEHTHETFQELAGYLFEKKAKSLTSFQMEQVLKGSGMDYSRLKLLVTYLCTFASYESLDQTISELSKLNKIELTNQYLRRISQVQNEHKPAGIMKAVFELLCFSPLPLTKEDLVDAICLDRGIDNEKDKDAVEKEIAFSLAFARDYLEVYDSRYTVNDETIKSVILFAKPCNNGMRLSPPINDCDLVYALRTVYAFRLMSETEISDADARNFSRIVMQETSQDFRDLLLLILDDRKKLYQLAKGIDKEELIRFFKCLSLQSMGQSIQTHRTDAGCQTTEEDFTFMRMSNVMTEKIFSVARKNHLDNRFLHYYTAALGLKERDLLSVDAFAAYVDGVLSGNGGEIPYHIMPVHNRLQVTAGNTTCYTMFDETEQSYMSCYCCCDCGFAIIADLFTGRMKKAYPILRNAGPVISVFYQDKNLHIIFRSGVRTVIDLIGEKVNSFRFDEEGTEVTFFKQYYHQGYELAVLNGNTIAIYKALRRVQMLKLKEGLKVCAVYGIPVKGDNLEKLIAVVKTAEDDYACWLIDPVQPGITAARNLIEILDSIQNEETGELYLYNEANCSYAVGYAGEDELTLNLAEDRYYLHTSNFRIYQKEDGVYVNDHQIPGVGGILNCFTDRKMSGFISENGVAYCFDNGY